VDLKDRIAVVTGAASGISRAMAAALGAAGAQVWLADIDAEGADRAAAELREKGVSARARRLDVTDPSEAQAFMAGVERESGRIDVLFNGAGIINRRPVLDLSFAEWRRLLSINLDGVFLCSQVAARLMVRQGHGRIINVASGLAQGRAGDADYAASKAAVIAFTKSFAGELRALRVDVTVNAIAPGATDTPLWRKDRSPEEIARLLAGGTIHNPGDMASVVVFLAGASSWPINGQVIGRG